MAKLRILVRRLLRTPGFTTLAVLTLAVGLGANAAIFSVVWGVILRPLPFPEPDRLVGVWSHAPALDVPDRIPQAPESYVLIRDRNRSFRSVALLNDTEVTLTGGERPRRVQSARVTSSAFDVLGVAPLHGRVFNEEDDDPGGPRVVILSHGSWSRDFGADPSVLGRTIEIGGNPFEVVGVMPEDFRDLYEGTELWMPFRIDEAELPAVSFSYDMIGRLADGVTTESATRDVNRIMERLPEAYPGGITREMYEQARWSNSVTPVHADIVGDLVRPLWILLGSVGFVLLIACANVANLFVVRAEGRQREVALRTALGAERGDLIRHYLGESVTLALVAGAVGLALAWVGVEGLLALSPAELPRAGGVGLAPPVIGFTAVLSLLAGLAFGLLPLTRGLREDVAGSLKEGGRGGSAGRETHRLRNLLVVGQMALAVVLLVGSGLLLRSVQELQSVDPGFDTEGALTFRVTLDRDYTDETAETFWQQLDTRLATLPGVTAVGSADNIPLSEGESNNALVVEDFPPEPGGLPEVVRTVRAGPGYFESMGIPVLRGRTLTTDDLRTGEPVVVISRSLAERLWGNADPIGRRVSPEFSPDGEISQWMSIVGVVEDVHDSSLRTEAEEMVYLPRSYRQADGERDTDYQMVFTVAASGNATALAEPARRAVWALDPGLPVMSVQTTGAIVRNAMAQNTFTMILVAIAAVVALLLGTVGLYGVVSYVVGQRTREIGVRMALGADRSRVRGMVVRQGLTVALTGIAIGLVGAFGATRLMESLLFGVSATDPASFAGAPVALLIVSVTASWIPAWRASRIQPSEALRNE